MMMVKDMPSRKAQDASLAEEVLTAAAGVADRVREIREDIHAHPELRFQERRTADLCARELEALGIDVRRNVGGTGVVGLLRGGGADNAGKTVAFRAEMDALPADDRCGRSYASTVPGVAHLCGHDGHVAALLGAAMVLSKLRARVPGAVKFFFEPAEENAPRGEKSGAEAMIADGALDDPTPDAIFGGHFYPDWPAGSIALRVGSSFSGNDSVDGGAPAEHRRGGQLYAGHDTRRSGAKPARRSRRDDRYVPDLG